VDGLELYVYERSAYEERKIVFAVDVLFEVAEQSAQFLRRRRNEDRLARTSATGLWPVPGEQRPVFGSVKRASNGPSE